MLGGFPVGCDTCVVPCSKGSALAKNEKGVGDLISAFHVISLALHGDKGIRKGSHTILHRIIILQARWMRRRRQRRQQHLGCPIFYALSITCLDILRTSLFNQTGEVFLVGQWLDNHFAIDPALIMIHKLTCHYSRGPNLSLTWACSPQDMVLWQHSASLCSTPARASVRRLDRSAIGRVLQALQVD